MGLESATYISQLSATNPLATDPISQGDDHLRLIKSVLQSQFSSLGAAAVSGTAAELNLVDGCTATTAELNYLDITTLGTSENSKAVTQNASGAIVLGATAGDQTVDIASHDLVDGGLKLAGTLVTASAAEINKLDGLSASTTELDYNNIATLGTVEVSKSVSADSSGIVNHADYVVQRPTLKDYSESYTASSGSGSTTLDMTTGNVFQHTATGNVTFVFSNPSASGTGCAFTLKWIQDSSDRTITWPASVDWKGGSAPSVTSGSAKVDVYTFFTVDAGTIWYGFQPGSDMS